MPDKNVTAGSKTQVDNSVKIRLKFDKFRI